MRLLLILLLALPSVAAAKDLVLDVTSRGQRAVGTLLQVMDSEDISARVLYDSLAWRIGFNGMFALRDVGLLPESVLRNSAPQWRYLRGEGVDISLLIRVYFVHDGNRTKLTVKAFSPGQSKPVFDRIFAARRGNAEFLFDTAINRLYEQLTGAKGPFGENLFFQYRPLNKRQRELYRFRLGGREPVQATSRMRIAMRPRSSPDGRTITFIGYRNARPEVWELTPTSGTIRLAIPASAPAYGAVRGSDGRLYYSHANGRYTELRRSTARGSELIAGGRSMNLGIDLAPNDAFAVFTSDRFGNPHLFRLDRLSPRQKPVRLTWNGEYNASPRISPDGRWVAFARREGGSFSIFAVDREGKQLRRLTDDKGSDEDPAWSQDGRTIYFSANRHRSPKSGTDLYAVDFWTGKINRITRFNGDERMPEPLRQR